MPLPSSPDDLVGSAAHIVQTALTPVFLLSGIGTLLGVFNTRLARVSDQVAHTHELLKGEADDDEKRELDQHLRRYQRRVFVLDASVMLGATGGAATCLSVFVLFLGGVRDAEIGSWLVGLFGVALACTIGSLAAFLIDSLLAWHGLRHLGPLPRSTRASRRWSDLLHLDRGRSPPA